MLDGVICLFSICYENLHNTLNLKLTYSTNEHICCVVTTQVQEYITTFYQFAHSLVTEQYEAWGGGADQTGQDCHFFKGHTSPSDVSLFLSSNIWVCMYYYYLFY